MELSSVVAMVRSYNNPYVTKAVGQLLSFLTNVVVIVNAIPDKGTTRGWLGDFKRDPRVSVLEMFEGYSWANALNAGLARVDSINASRAPNERYDFVFPVSVEAKFTADHVARMLSEFADSSVGTVGTSFRGLRNGQEIPLGSSYEHPRNTGMLIRHEVFARPMVRAFDPVCDGFGGMEDYDFLWRLRAYTEFRYTMMDLQAPLVVGVHYNQTEKEERERAAMLKIAEYRRSQTRKLELAMQQMGV